MANDQPKGTMKLSKSGVKSVQTLRDTGFGGERNDCVVHAVAAVAGVPYRDAHTFVASRLGRRQGRLTHNIVASMSTIEHGRETVFGYRAFGRTARVGTRYKHGWNGMQMVPTYATLESFARTHKTGRFLLWSNRHAFACVDGVIYDNGAAGPRTNVTGVYEFVASSKCEAAVAALPAGASACERIQAESHAV